jgi:hypothetical protein
MSNIDCITYKGSLPSSFFTIPKRIYEALPFSLPEDKLTIQKLFAIEAERNQIVIYTDHESVRLVGIFPVDDSTALFGFWETANDETLTHQAFQLLEKDAQAKGRSRLIGPINFNTFHNYRLRTGDVPGWIMFDREPVNPTYYPFLLAQQGFVTRASFESRLIPKKNIPDVYIDKALLLQELKKIPFDFIALNEDSWQQFEDGIFELVQAIFSENPMYRQVSHQQFKLLYNQQFARKLCPYSSVIFRDQASGTLAAISMCHPNYQLMDRGITQPVFERDFQKLSHKILLAKTVGVHPQYRQQGLMNYMGAYGMLSFREYYDEVLFCLMRSDNFSLHFTDNLTYEAAKYVLFEKSI